MRKRILFSISTILMLLLMSCSSGSDESKDDKDSNILDTQDIDNSTPDSNFSDVGEDRALPDEDFVAVVCLENEKKRIKCEKSENGFLWQICKNNSWKDDGECIVPEKCETEGEKREGKCGTDGKGTKREVCQNGFWNTKAGCYYVSQWGGNEADTGRYVTVDSQKNVYITGFTMGDMDGNIREGMLDIFLSKFDSDGKKLWTKQLGCKGRSAGNAVAVNSVGDIFVTGYTTGELDGQKPFGESDIFLTKFDSTGDKKWTKVWGSPENDIAMDILIDKNGSVYVAGSTFGSFEGAENSGDQDLIILKVNSDGEKEELFHFGTPFFESANRIALDAEGSMIIMGESAWDAASGESYGGKDFFVMKIDKNRELIWKTQFGTAKDDSGVDMAVADDGAIYTAGFTYGGFDAPSFGEIDIFLSKFSSSGEVLFTNQLGTDNFDLGKGVAVNKMGEIFLCGETYGTIENLEKFGKYDLLLSLVGQDGQTIETTLFGTTGDEQCHAIYANSEKLYITGHSSRIFKEAVEYNDDTYINSVFLLTAEIE